MRIPALLALFVLLDLRAILPLHFEARPICGKLERGNTSHEHQYLATHARLSSNATFDLSHTIPKVYG